MSVRIRLTRMGKKKRPHYRLVAIDSRRARDGKFLEILGTYNPIAQPAVLTIREDLITKWLDLGASPSSTVNTLLTQVGFNEKFQKAKRGEDVSGIELKTTIDERPKKTRKVKKAALMAAEAAKAEAEAKAKAAKEAEEAKAKAAKEAEEAEAAKAAEGSDEAPAAE